MCFFFFDLFLMLVFLLLFGFFFVSRRFLNGFGFFFSLLHFFKCLNLWVFFDKSSINFQFLGCLEFCVFFDFDFLFGFDGISLFFVIFTGFIMPICFVLNWKNKNFFKPFYFCYVVLLFLITGSFLILDLLVFYVFFESILLPMFFIIGLWGSRKRKFKASYYFFLFTVFGSFFLLFSFLVIFCELGTLNYFIFIEHQIFYKKQLLLWLFLFFGFAIKVPVFPFHLWLLEAHVESPTVGSIILASLLLKLGTFGFIRFILPTFNFANKFYIPFIYLLSCLGILYGKFIFFWFCFVLFFFSLVNCFF